MISHISIENFAIIENVDIDFYDGLNIITGETGAGKSIVIEAISLALGSRADTAFIRSGKNKATVQLVCDHKGEEFVITRELSSTGKNLCKLNGKIVALTELKDICKKLADIHGQYDHQSLLDSDYHIKLIDSYKKELIAPAKEELEQAYSQYRNIKSKLNNILNSQREDQRKRDFMTFELDEIKKAQLVPEEDKKLQEQITLLQNSEKIYESLASCYDVLSSDISSSDAPSVLSGLNSCLSSLRQVSSYSEELGALETELSDIYYNLEDMTSNVRSLKDGSVYSQEELDTAIARMDIIDSLKRKYGGTIDDVMDYGLALEEKLKYIDNMDEHKEELEKELLISEKHLKEVSENLSDLRKAAAKVLETKIQQELSALNFKDAKLQIEFSREADYTPSGIDKVEFLISTNKGEELKPLSKIASGGEISRIMLAFKKIIGDYDEIPTMIFDEIDSGISGVTASVVGKNLLDISKNHQILCITHLPQIAAFGLNNYKISKSSDDSTTYTTVTHLNSKEKIEEIARLVGGLNITEKTIENAKELIEQSQ